MMSHFASPMDLAASLVVLLILTVVCVAGAVMCHRSADREDNPGDMARYLAARWLACAFALVFGSAAGAVGFLMWVLA